MAPAIRSTAALELNGGADVRVLRQLLDLAPEPVCATGPDGRVAYANAAWQRALGYSSADLAALRLIDLVAPEARARYADQTQPLRRGQGVDAFETTLVACDGRRLPCRARLLPHLADDATVPDGAGAHAVYVELIGSAAGATGAVPTSLRSGDGEDGRLRDVLGGVSALALQLDAAGVVTFVNQAFLDATMWTRQDVMGADWFEYFVPARAGMRELFVEGSHRGERSARIDAEVFTCDGSRRLVAWELVYVRDGDGRAAGVALVGRDVTDERRSLGERAELERAIEALADRDELTGLLNRRGFHRMIEHAAKVAARTRRLDAVVCVRLDGIRAIALEHGEAPVADAVCAVSEALCGAMRDSDVVARVDTAAFAIYAIGITKVGDGQDVAARIRAALHTQNAHARQHGRAFDVAYTMGVAEREPGDDLDMLLARAESVVRPETAHHGHPGVR